jgi:hypothetical protein
MGRGGAIQKHAVWAIQSKISSFDILQQGGTKAEVRAGNKQEMGLLDREISEPRELGMFCRENAQATQKRTGISYTR